MFSPEFYVLYLRQPTNQQEKKNLKTQKNPKTNPKPNKEPTKNPTKNKPKPKNPKVFLYLSDYSKCLVKHN